MVDVAQLVRASDCGSEGRRFDPGPPPQKSEEAVGNNSLFAFFRASAFQLPYHPPPTKEKTGQGICPAQ